MITNVITLTGNLLNSEFGPHAKLKHLDKMRVRSGSDYQQVLKGSQFRRVGQAKTTKVRRCIPNTDQRSQFLPSTEPEHDVSLAIRYSGSSASTLPFTVSHLISARSVCFSKQFLQGRPMKYFKQSDTRLHYRNASWRFVKYFRLMLKIELIFSLNNRMSIDKIIENNREIAATSKCIN